MMPKVRYLNARSEKVLHFELYAHPAIYVIVGSITNSYSFPEETPKGNVVMFFSSLSSLCFYLYQLISDIPKETRRMLQLRGLHVTMMAEITKVRILCVKDEIKPSLLLRENDLNLLSEGCP